MAAPDRARLFCAHMHKLVLDRFPGHALARVLEAGVEICGSNLVMENHLISDENA